MANDLVVGLDGSEASDRALDYALAHTGASMTLHLVNIIDWSPFMVTTLEDNEQRGVIRTAQMESAQAKVLKPAIERARAAGIACTHEARFGLPAEELTRIAHDRQAQSIVIGRTGASRLARIVFGSMASRVIQMTDVPVVVVP